LQALLAPFQERDGRDGPSDVAGNAASIALLCRNLVLQQPLNCGYLEFASGVTQALVVQFLVCVTGEERVEEAWNNDSVSEERQEAIVRLVTHGKPA